MNTSGVSYCALHSVMNCYNAGTLEFEIFIRTAASYLYVDSTYYHK